MKNNLIIVLIWRSPTVSWFLILRNYSFLHTYQRRFVERSNCNSHLLSATFCSLYCPFRSLLLASSGQHHRLQCTVGQGWCRRLEAKRNYVISQAVLCEWECEFKPPRDCIHDFNPVPWLNTGTLRPQTQTGPLGLFPPSLLINQFGPNSDHRFCPKNWN